MARRSWSVLGAAALAVAIGGCLTPVSDTGGGSGTGGGNGSGGTSGGTGGVSCPSTCPIIHSSCDSTTNGKCACDYGYTPCGASCVSLTSDSRNCGSCGNVCDATSGYTCLNSTCVCGAGMFGLCPATDGGADVCSDPTSDPHNCGSCGNDCGSLQCSNSSCTCNAPLQECVSPAGARYCANISNDIDNCGGCGALCGPPEQSHAGRAIAWQCVSQTGGPGFCACNTGYFGCQAPYGPVNCVDLATDSQNCGACNNVCDVNACTNSRCCLGGNQPGCFVDADCCPGLHCNQNTNVCVP
jgi:hypothetical protein